MKRLYLTFLVTLASLGAGSFEAVAEAPIRNLINRELIWCYSPGSVMGICEFQMQFGNDTVIDQKNYTEFYTARTTWIHYGKLGWVLEELGEGRKFHIREENRRVYLYLGKEESGSESNLRECLIYDFNLKKGDSYSSVDSFMEPITYKVEDTFEWDLGDGIKYNCQKLSLTSGRDSDTYSEFGFYMIEGIGPTFELSGTLVGPQLLYCACIPSSPEGLYPNGKCEAKLSHVLDRSNGKFIWNPGLFLMDVKNKYKDTDKNSVSKTSISPEEIGITYSLQGLPVTNPQPGQIYIRNGKKFVMPN